MVVEVLRTGGLGELGILWIWGGLLLGCEIGIQIDMFGSIIIMVDSVCALGSGVKVSSDE